MAEIVSAVGSFLGGVTIEVVKWAAAPIVREFNYLCCFTGNINALRDGAGILETETTQLRRRAGAEENNGQVIFGEVEGWLENSDSMKTETDGILVEALNFKSGWLKFRERYSISKKAKKAAIAVNELLEKSKFDELSYPPPIAGTSLLVSSEKVHNFESRRQIEVEIMKSLEDKSVKRIGICGMGGVGKTTLAQEVMNRALEKGLFDEVVMAVVGQSMDKINVQLQIAEPLGLELVDQTLIPRACKIRDRLMGKKRALIILDDVWESINFMELGIPCEPDSKGCTIILTSRNGDVLKAMNVKKARELKILDMEEAWFLFKDKAGTCVDDAELKPTAEGVMRECDGLPLALTVVGVALKDEIRLPIWKDALRQLRRGNPADIPDFIDKVYKPLKLSYDRLGDENQNAKSLFLLCCLFRENSDIPLEHLTYFAMGLHLFEDVWELEEVRDRMLALIKTLKTRGLLLDGYDEVHVRMHDVVRDVSIFIALKEKLVKCSNCTWISSHVGGGARLVSQEASRFPKLKLLFMNAK